MNAFGAAGEETAAIYNALVLPFFVVTGFLLIGFYGAGAEGEKIGTRIRRAFITPVFIAAVASLVTIPCWVYLVCGG